MQIIVTLLSNIQVDAEGKFLFDEEGGLLLHDEEDVGVLMKTHVVPLTQVIEGVVNTGISSLAEVYWNKVRSPAPALVSPNDIAWLTVGDENEMDEEENDENDDGAEPFYEESEEALDFRSQN